MKVQANTTDFSIPKNWPFKTYNGQQTQESLDLEKLRLYKSRNPIKDSIDQLEEALF